MTSTWPGDERAARAFGGHANQPVRSRAAGFLRGRRQPLLAQPIDRRLDVAAGLDQRLFTIHHPGAGLLTQFLDQAGRDLHHNLTFHIN